MGIWSELRCGSTGWNRRHRKLSLFVMPRLLFRMVVFRKPNSRQLAARQHKKGSFVFTDSILFRWKLESLEVDTAETPLRTFHFPCGQWLRDLVSLVRVQYNCLRLHYRTSAKRFVRRFITISFDVSERGFFYDPKQKPQLNSKGMLIKSILTYAIMSSLAAGRASSGARGRSARAASGVHGDLGDHRREGGWHRCRGGLPLCIGDMGGGWGIYRWIYAF